MQKHLYFLSALASCVIAGTAPAYAESALSQPVAAAPIAPLAGPASPAPAHDPAFEEMLAHVYQDNPQLKAERESLRALDERVAQQAAGYRPQIAATGGVGEARVSENNAAWHYGLDRNEALTVTQTVYNASTNGQWRAAEKRVLEGRARLLALEQKVLFTAITAWLDMYEKDRLLNLDRDNREVAGTYLDATRQRFAAGDGTDTDLALADSRAADAATRLAMAEAASEGAHAAYERATGLRAQPAALPALPRPLPESAEETVALAKKNPDMEQAGYEVAATEDDIDSAAGTRWPTIFLRGSLSDESAEDLGLARLRSDSITINASFPLYQGGAEYSREREAKILHEKSRYDRITTERNVTEEARQAWSRYHAAAAIIDSSQHAAESAQRAQAGIEEEQKHGTRTLTEVLDAEAQTLNARITALQTESDLRVAAYRLLAAVGRLTAAGLNLPTAVYDPVPHYEDVTGRWFGTSIGENGD